jgi:EmrB/QacA subfamily drug resistance transporter
MGSDAPASASASRGTTSVQLVALPYRSKVLIVAALCVSLFVATINQGIVATAAQNIVADIGGFEQFTWLFAGFALTSAVAVPIVGKLSDNLGRKTVIMWSLVLFLAATAACGAAMSMTQLVLARGLQGIGFSGVMGSVWIIMAALWAPQDRAKWMGVTAAGFTLSGVLGPVVGGVVSEELHWRWIFYLGLPVGAGALALLGIWMPASGRHGPTRQFDYAGAVAFGIASTAGLLALNWSGEAFGWTSPVTLGLVVLAIAGVIGFIAAERRAADPMVPLPLFRARIFRLGMVASVTITSSFVVVSIFMPLFIQGVLGKPATIAAIPLIGMTFGVAVGSNIAGQIMSRVGRVREIAVVGFTGGTAALLYLSRIGPDMSFVVVTAISFVLGLSVSCGFTAYTVPVQNAMPAKFLGVVTTNLQFARVLGMATGSAVFGALLLIQVTAALPAFPEGSPSAELAKPEVIVNADRLSEIRDEFSQDPVLGIEAYEIVLADTRAAITRAVRLVFAVAAGVTAVGGALSLFAFSGRVPADLQEPEQVPVPRPVPASGSGGTSDS